MKKKLVYSFLIIIVLTGIFLRFYDLGQENFWTDEAVSLIEANQETPQKVIELVTKSEGSPYGHHLFLHYWIKVFGNSEFSVRFISALFGVFSIIILFFIVRIFFSDNVALLSSLFLSTAMLQILYSQEARLYSVFNFLVLLSTFFFVKYFTIKSVQKTQEQVKRNPFSRNKQRYLIAYIISIVLAMYLNYLTLFLIVLHSLFFVYTPKKVLLKEWFYSLMIIAFLSIPLVRPLFVQFLNRHQSLPTALLSRGLPEIFTRLGLFFYLLPLLFFFFIFVCLIFISKKTKLFSRIMAYKNMFLLILFLMGFLYLFLLDLLLHSFSLVRHSFFMVPILYVLIAKMIMLMNERKLRALIIILILFFNSFALYTYYSEVTKAPWDKAVVQIKEHSPSYPLILFDQSGSNLFLFKYYWDKEGGGDFKQINLSWKEEGRSIQISEENLFNTLDSVESFWLVSSRDIKTREYYLNLFQKHYTLIGEYHDYRLDLYYFKSSN